MLIWPKHRTCGLSEWLDHANAAVFLSIFPAIVIL
jgi:hypothetical protein